MADTLRDRLAHKLYEREVKIFEQIGLGLVGYPEKSITLLDEVDVVLADPEIAAALELYERIPNGKYCLGCPLWVADLCKAGRFPLPVVDRMKNDFCIKPFVEAK